MTKSEKSRVLKTNTIYWITAMILPAIFYFGFKAFASESARFPWPVLIPFLYLGLMTGSNALITRAIGETTDAPAGK
jgi:hypothetical protein